MACTICGEEGHNSRTCSKKDKMIKNEEKRDRAIILRMDNMTAEEQDLMSSAIKKAKKELTSDKVSATLIEGKSSELPSKIRDFITQNDNQLLPLEKKDNE
ncbi:hypothetical protein [Aliarcobacter butzleri]|uniref:hypothetical protein n=1 Tax=Aliarcobacter butzleri TaxID=28197 RepID=UPI0012FC6F51|nr:hypothetical protein [Aliarcobacter butzleri]